MKIEWVQKQTWAALCAAALAAGCNNAKVKSEAETAAEHLKQAGHETVEAGKAIGRAGEAAGKEAVDKAAEEGERIREKVDQAAGNNENPPSTPQPPDTK